MTKDENYPECLRRGDAGGHVQTRTAQTEKRYRKRYEGMAKTWCRQHRMDEVTPFELAQDIGYRSSDLSANALRQYHAAIRQCLRDLWNEGTITLGEVERVDALFRQQTPMSKSAKGKAGGRSSAGRAKSIKPETLSSLVTELLFSATATRRIAAALLEYGVELATRPGEFLSMREDPLGRLWVRSAKYSRTNAKGLQPARMLILDNLAPFEISELKEIAALLLIERDKGATIASLLRRCQHAIREARKAVGGRSRKVTAYTVRHQARANMAASGMTPEEVAVVMNHASAMTAQSHYAPARSAWRGARGMKPLAVDPDLAAKVRAGNRSRGWTAQQLRGPKPK
ncbi:hypothetical protein [Devosia faecipullorum]|jgi:hypothetical protein|uniref:hypothetical protein n=1 Tax=Devosia faecipullorum TaxID=2755039 RepID=UPI00187BB5BB|nr:hypothetical protein [Devosia faecipullorum]MBE7733258.1 hypothetical protein [Devosia faecipullorum]